MRFRRNGTRSPRSGTGSTSSYRPGQAHIVSDTLAVVFIDAHPRARSPHGRLPEAAPPCLDATPRSEAQAAEDGPRPSHRVDPVPRDRSAAGLYGGPRADGLCRDLHRSAWALLAIVASFP